MLKNRLLTFFTGYHEPLISGNETLSIFYCGAGWVGMFVCVCVSVSVCMCAFVCVCGCNQIVHVCVCVYVYVCMWVCPPLCIDPDDVKVTEVVALRVQPAAAGAALGSVV